MAPEVSETHMATATMVMVMAMVPRMATQTHIAHTRAAVLVDSLSKVAFVSRTKVQLVRTLDGAITMGIDKRPMA